MDHGVQSFPGKIGHCDTAALPEQLIADARADRAGRSGHEGHAAPQRERTFAGNLGPLKRPEFHVEQMVFRQAQISSASFLDRPLDEKILLG